MKINLKFQIVFIEKCLQYFCRPICSSKIKIIFLVGDMMTGFNGCCAYALGHCQRAPGKCQGFIFSKAC